MSVFFVLSWVGKVGWCEVKLLGLETVGVC